MSRERNKIIAALLGTAVAVVVLAVVMFIGLSKNGSTEKITSEQIAVGEDHMLAVDAGGILRARKQACARLCGLGGGGSQ